MEPTFPALLWAVCCLWIFTGIAGVDGLYFHLYRYRLYSRPASMYEHKLHTVNAVLFVPQVVLLFLFQARGLWLWLLLGLFLTTVAVEITDVLCEEDSRRDIGGLTSLEYLMHFLMAGLRFGWVVPILFGLPSEAWSPATSSLTFRSLWMLIAGGWIAGPATIIAVIHVILALRTYPPDAQAKPAAG